MKCVCEVCSRATVWLPHDVLVKLAEKLEEFDREHDEEPVHHGRFLIIPRKNLPFFGQIHCDVTHQHQYLKMVK